MNKLTFKRVWSPNRRRRRDTRHRKKNLLARPSPRFSFSSRRKCQVANRRTLLRAAATRQKIGEHSFFTRLVLFCDRDAAYKNVRCENLLWQPITRTCTYCTRIVMAIRYGLFVQKLFRACRPEKEPIYPRQICVRPRWWRSDPPRYVATVAGTLINICLRCFPLEINVFALRMFLVSATRIVICFIFWSAPMVFSFAFRVNSRHTGCILD